jgi:penicillin-binding protein 1B
MTEPEIETKTEPEIMPDNSKRNSRRYKIFKILAVVLAIPVIALAAFLMRYYYIFDGLIEEKLGKRYSLASTEIYAAPLALYPGKRISLAEIESKVRRAGYEENAKDTSVAYFKIEKPNRIVVYNDISDTVNPGQLVRITFSGNSIISLVDVNNKRELSTFSLKPEMLSTGINENREKRRLISFQELPKVLINAVLSAEDKRFFSHRGIDPVRIIKALIVDVREGEAVQGASTLTQQFIKNYFLTPERTWRRKFADAYMSLLLEKRLSKEEIFELYSNEVYLGQAGSFSIVGFGKAADVFFHKNVQELTLEEAATLAGIITAPNRFAPLRYPERAKVRRNRILDEMEENQFISTSERDKAKASPLVVKSSSILNYSDAPYFIDFVQDILVAKYGDIPLARSKYKAYTTLDVALQQAAFEAVRNGITSLDDYFAKRKQPIPPGTVQASLIAVDPKNGQILAMVGGRNYGASQFNRITQSKRQPGSIFKPFVYAAALETAGYSSTPLTAVTRVLDEPSKFNFDDLEYIPKNFKEEYYGQVTMRQAITKSMNIATIKIAEKVGYDKIAELSQRLGLNEKIKPYPAMAIGAFEVTPLEMVRAYTAFANGGLLSTLTPLLKVNDGENKTVYFAQSMPQQALTPQIAFMITSLLQSVINNGTGAGARSAGFVLPAAGKTGTSHDGWFAGYTPDLLCIVWVGFDDNRELNLPGSQSALPIWTEFMKKAAVLRPLKGEDFVLPDGITEVEIDPTTGLLATERCFQREKEFFIKGSEPTLPCYGNNYEQALESGAPVSIYSTPNKPAQPAPEVPKP